MMPPKVLCGSVWEWDGLRATCDLPRLHPQDRHADATQGCTWIGGDLESISWGTWQLGAVLAAPQPPPQTAVDAVAAVLWDHRPRAVTVDGVQQTMHGCVCGWEPPTQPRAAVYDRLTAHRQHLATELAHLLERNHP